MSPAKLSALVIAASVSCVSVRAAEPAGEAVAVVSSLSGRAALLVPRSSRRQAVATFDWLPARAVVTVGAGSRLTLAFVTGKRCEIEGPSEVRLSASGPLLRSGILRPLPSVPPLPRLPALARGTHAGARAGGVRIRTGSEALIRGLYPNAEARTLADATSLRFVRTDGVCGSYHVEIDDERGLTVFEADTQSTSVPVPAETLSAGARYLWRVRAVDRAGYPCSGQAELVTLAAEDALRRLELGRWLDEHAEPELSGLRAEIDRRLGLWLQARDGFRAALATSLDPDAVRARLARLERRIRGDEPLLH